VEHAHFAERFQLFVIIALGESIVIAGATASTRHLTAGRWSALALGFALSAALWWLYFDEIARRAVEEFKAAVHNRGRLGRDAYTFLHIPIVAGVIVAAVGLELVIAHPDATLSGRGLVALAAGPVLYLAGHLGFRLRMTGTLAKRRITAMPAIVVAVLATSGAPSLVSLAVVVLVLILLAASETVGRLSTARRGLA
jgi:low temperature requirement protein LtrA